MQLYSFISENWKADGGTCFGVVPKSIWAKQYPCDENNLIPLVCRSLLIKTENQLILVDTGMGRKRDDKFYQYKYLDKKPNISKNIESLGFTAEEVTDIIFTHLHDDHVGGATSRNEDGSIKHVFPNAKYHTTETQWNWALNPNKREAASYFTDNLLPLQESGRLILHKENGELNPDVQFRIYNGHTRGQLIPFINYNGKTIVFTADFIPSTTHIPLPYIASHDVEPLLSLEEKEVFLNEAANNNYLLSFVHDAFTECCSLTRNEKNNIIVKDIIKIENL